jgi:glycosyltransferase involved in cell wall biosynthesis
MIEMKSFEGPAAPFQFRIDRGNFFLTCPTRFYDMERVLACVKAAGPHFDCRIGGGNRLYLRGTTGDGLYSNVNALFSEINRYPKYFQYDWSGFRNSDNPVVSCVILLALNDLFVRTHLLPSIIKNSPGYGIEIIIVNNGWECEVAPFAVFPVIESNCLSVAKAYNLGIRQAKGKYIAVFHDDCMLDDKRWIDKALEGLNGSVFAMTGEFADNTAKCTPLVMKKETFLELDGFDEFYSGGNEDRDLTYTIVSRGGKIRVGIKAIHFQGVSTILLLSKNTEEFRNAAACNVLPLRAWREIKNFHLAAAMTKGVDVIMARDMLHFNQKFKKMIFPSEERYAAEWARLNELIARNSDSPLLREDFRSIPGLLETLKS